MIPPDVTGPPSSPSEESPRPADASGLEFTPKPDSPLEAFFPDEPGVAAAIDELRQIEATFASAHEELCRTVVSVEAADGAIVVEVAGDGIVRAVRIDADLAAEGAAALEEAVREAMNKTGAALVELTTAHMQTAAERMGITPPPGWVPPRPGISIEP